MEIVKESDLYLPVKNYLEKLGYDVKGEVKDCDITAVCGEELIVVELKRGFTMELLYQVIRRQRIADAVYAAIPLPKKGYWDPRYHDMVSLCRRLELGLIFVGFTIEGKAQIDVAVHPAAGAAVRRNKKKRMAVLTEHHGRTGSVNSGGVSRRKILTVYKEQALYIAQILHVHGPLKVDEIRTKGGPEKTSTILQKNFYKWYHREQIDGERTYTYSISEEGLQALIEYADLLK